MKKIVPLVVIAALLVSGVAYAGYRYAQGKKTAGSQNGQWQNQAGGSAKNAAGARRGGGMVAGEITAKEADNLTIKLPEGGSKIIFYSDATKISLYADIAAKDLAVGDQVTVAGQKSDSGEITAQSVQAGGVQAAASGAPGGQNADFSGQKNGNGDKSGAANGNMSFISGQITAINDSILTVKTSDGSEKAITLADSTKYSKISDSSADNLAEGSIIMVTGEANTDGSVTAKSIQIRPELPVIPAQNQLQNAPKSNITSQEGEKSGDRGFGPMPGGGRMPGGN